jgi:agmatinase
MHTPYNFGGLEKKYSGYKNSKIVILPVPFDKTTTWLKGSDRGPRAVIDASRNMELYDIPTNSEVYKKGIFTDKTIRAQTPEAMVNQVYARTKKLLQDKKFVVTLGGEHSVSVGAIKAHAGRFQNLSVLHLDAHSDRRDSYEGSRLSHASAMARAREMVKNIISVGIRSMDSSELKNIKKDKIFFSEDIASRKDWVGKVVNKLTRNVYATIDLDVFDPGIMPSTGTPEPGGLNWFQVNELLSKVVKAKNIIGFDVVELCPNPYNKAPDFLAAKLVYRLLSYIFF